jgi:hypothetical protein
MVFKDIYRHAIHTRLDGVISVGLTRENGSGETARGGVRRPDIVTDIQVQK